MRLPPAESLWSESHPFPPTNRTARPWLTALLAAALASPIASAAPVEVDAGGVLRWSDDHREVALFGANYSLPSACDFRAAGRVGADRKRLVEKDLAHFSRLGWDGIRLCFWGDWENSDADGNLIANEHLDVLDYAIAVAGRRGIQILLTPITTYSSLWPDGTDSDAIRGFSKAFPKGRLGTDPAAIAAQVRYLRQLLEHVNPYTGVALKDEPAIAFIEMINEPEHHPEDFSGSVAYIDALVDAVRSTGCTKLLFHNVSQDFRIVPAVRTSRVQGVTFAWYPTGLMSGHELTENHLRSVDDFAPMLRPDLLGVPKLVYEFDSADMNSAVMYPAMVRAFRDVGAQFIAMFSYDMLDTAAANVGWQTHFLNLVYSPRKALSAVIAAEAARTLPRGGRWGDYPDNTRFGPFRVSYEDDVSEMVTPETFLHAGDTRTAPPDPSALTRIAGVGTSPVVGYGGLGTYFLDRIRPGVWRLEVYPDVVMVDDPFRPRPPSPELAARLVARTGPMTVRLPDLGDVFAVAPLDAGNSWAPAVHAGTFAVRPGVYVLSRTGPVDLTTLPAQVGRVGLREFVCPTAPELPAQIVPHERREFPSGEPARFECDVVDGVAPTRVQLHFRFAAEPEFRRRELTPEQAYRFAAVLPAEVTRAGRCEYFFTAETQGRVVRAPVADGACFQTEFVAPRSSLQLFAAERDGGALAYTRIGDAGRRGIFERRPAAEGGPAAWRLFLPLSHDRTLDDYTASLSVKARIRERGAGVLAADRLRIVARSAAGAPRLHVTLVEADGTSWGASIALSPHWSEQVVRIDELRATLGVQLPLGFPGRWNYWLPPARGRGGAADRPKLGAVERLQVSFRPEPRAVAGAADDWADLATIELLTPAGATDVPKR